MKKVSVLSRRGLGAAILIAVSSTAVTSVAHGQFGSVPGVGPTAPTLPRPDFRAGPMFPRSSPTTEPYLGSPRAMSFGPSTARSHRSYLGSRSSPHRGEPIRTSRGAVGRWRWRTLR
jgi:hypothetical protein